MDIGCGSGDFINSLPPDKWGVYGVEPNPVGYNQILSAIIYPKIFEI